MKYKKSSILLLLMILLLVSSINVFAISGFDLIAAGINSTTVAEETGSLSDNAFEKYIAAGIFDTGDLNNSCSALYNSSRNNYSSLNDFLNNNSVACSEAKAYRETNESYSAYAANGLREQDKSDGRLNAAMEKFNENAHFVYTFLTGFGCLTSLLVFIIIFMRITWLPEHAIQRRKAMEDIVTSGVAVILLGGFWLVIGVFQSMFDRFWESYTVYSKDWVTAGNVFLVEYKTLITGILGIATLTAFLMFIKAITSVAIGGSNPAQKTSKMQQVLYCGLASAGLGSLTLFTGFFWNMLA